MARTTARPTRDEKRRDTRARILAAAGQVFARRGYHGASVDEIAGEAGYTKGAVYYNFTSKETLFLALLDQHMEARLGLLERLRQGDRPSLARLEEGATATVTSLKRDREWSLLYFEFAAYAARNPRFRRKLVTRLETLHRAMVETVAELLRDAGRRPSVPPETIALGLESIVDGVALNRLLRPDAIADDLLGSILALVWRGLDSR
jgi:AcrR family transcriptional regulator